jgi:two-component system, response regulator YesN
MYDKKMNASKKLYPKILFSFTISTTLTILLLSTVLYFNFEDIVLKTTNSFVKDNLAQISYTGTLMNKSANSLLMQMNIDEDIRCLLFDYTPDSVDLMRAQRRLASYVSANPFVQSAYVYNRSINAFYESGINAWSQDEFYDKEIIYILDNFQKYQKLTPVPRILKNPNTGLQTNVYTYIFFDDQLNKGSEKSDKAMVVNIDEKFIKDTINSMSSDKRNNIFIIDSTGVLLQTNTSAKMLSKISDRPFIQKVVRSTQSQGSFVDLADGEKSLVSFVSSSVLDWKFVCVTPYDIIMDRVNYMRDKTILICAILLAIGILASYLLSKKLYSPISFLQDNLQTLQIEQLNNLALNKKVFLKNMLLSGIDSPMESTLTSFRQYKIKMDPLEKYWVMVAKIDHYFDFCNQYNLSDRSLLKFGIMNIASEICESHFKNETLDLDEDHVVMIMNASDSDEHRQMLKDISTRIMESVLKYLEISISLSLSSPSQTLCDINTKYTEALDASQYRVYSGSNSIILYQDIADKHTKGFSYPIQRENKLIDALMLGNIEEVQSIFNEILDTATKYSYKSFILTLTRMTTTIHIAVDNFEKNGSYHIGYDFSKFIMELNKLEYLDEIRRHFSGLFEHIYDKLLERKDSKYDEMIAKVMEIIHLEYADKNLSLESIADRIGISASYVGKLFKQFTSNTISDYITQTRLEASKKLLASSDYSIDRITEKIGLTYSNYFYKIFKKTYGITPSEYKKGLSLQKGLQDTE